MAESSRHFAWREIVKAINPRKKSLKKELQNGLSVASPHR
jgi:hypothetical protein